MRRRRASPAREPGPGRLDLARAGRRVDVVVDGIPYSTFHPDRPWSGYAWDAIAAGAVWARAERPAVVLLGAGAGTVLVLLRRLLPEARLSAVELDERILALGRMRFGLDATGAELIVGDAVEHLARTRRTFDVVLDDMFAPTADGLGRPVEDEEAHLRRMASRLAPGGVAATNVTTDGDPPALARRVAAAYRAVFPHVLKLTPRRGFNAVLVGSARTLDVGRLREVADRLAPTDREGLLGVRVRRG